MAALSATVLAPAREARSFLFLVQGQGREGLGLHHDGPVDAFWLQLEGRRTVTFGPPVPRGTPEELPDTYASRPGAGDWRTVDLEPGTLFYMPPRTPHRVLCRGRSLAVSLTWRRAGRARDGAAGLAEWDVASGRADRVPGQPDEAVDAGAGDRGTRRARRPRLRPAPAGRRADPASGRRAAGGRRARGHAVVACAAAAVRSRRARPADRARHRRLRDLPLLIIPAAPRKLDGWRFA